MNTAAAPRIQGIEEPFFGAGGAVICTAGIRAGGGSVGSGFVSIATGAMEAGCACGRARCGSRIGDVIGAAGTAGEVGPIAEGDIECRLAGHRARGGITALLKKVGQQVEREFVVIDEQDVTSGSRRAGRIRCDRHGHFRKRETRSVLLRDASNAR